MKRGMPRTRGLEMRYGGGGLLHARREENSSVHSNGDSPALSQLIIPQDPNIRWPHNNSRPGFRARTRLQDCIVGTCEGLTVLSPGESGNMTFMVTRGLIDQWLDPNPGDVFNAMMHYLAHNGIVPQDDAFQQCKDAFFAANAKFITSPSDFTNPDFKQPGILQNVGFILPKICRKPLQGRQSRVVQEKLDSIPTPSSPSSADEPLRIESPATAVIVPSHTEPPSIHDKRTENAQISSGLVFGGLAVIVVIRYFAKNIFVPKYPQSHSSPAHSQPSSQTSHPANDPHRTESSAPISNTDIPLTDRLTDGLSAVFSSFRIVGVIIKSVAHVGRELVVTVSPRYPETDGLAIDRVGKDRRLLLTLLSQVQTAAGGFGDTVRVVFLGKDQK